ncbi:MAG: Wzz/FepE/Etk N-terminal domain-containing protein [Prolixibacteraceae bacterium]|nr:Wzz/FepE/Etk N-terminal domain-containing protein [Prolixibacteraceae bacterium]
MDNFFDNSRILKTVWKWKFHIGIAVFIAIIVSAIISGPAFITPKFKSTARIYPANISEVSEESTSEHLLEYLQSTDLRFKLINNFKLYDVYDIKPEGKFYKAYILDEYRRHVEYKKTNFETVEISVLDKDPVRARDMVDSLIVFVNDAIHREKAKINYELANAAKKELSVKSAEIDSIEALIDNIREETGLIDYFAQAVTATRGLMDAAAMKGDDDPARETLSHLTTKGTDLRRNLELLVDSEIKADTLRKRYEKYYNRAANKISYSKIVEHPFVADKKAHPIRWLIVFLATLGTGIISIITVLLIDYIREVKSTL